MAQPTSFLQKPIFLDHDGSVDDFVALLHLLTLDQYRITGIAITDANCYIDSAVETTLRILDLFCRKDIEVALSNEQAINSFPEEWRRNKEFIKSIEILSNRILNQEKISALEAAEFTAAKLLAEPEKTTIVLTGPASNLAKTFEKYPEAIEKVEKVLWMAGAFLADGNVKAPDHDGSAEWNVFWNPIAASSLLKTGIPIFLFPLDTCKQLPVDNYFMYHLNAAGKELSNLAYQLFQPNYQAHERFYMWDVVPTVYLGKPELFQFENSAIDVELRGTSRGNIYRSSKGSKVKYSKFIDDEGFYDFLLEQFQQF